MFGTHHLTGIDIHEHVRSYMERGLLPVPLRPGSKHLDLAAIGYDERHYLSGNKHLRELAFRSACYHLAHYPPDCTEWLARFSKNSNIGFVCGYGGLCVLDFDHESAYDLWAKECPEIAGATPVVSTPSGRHVYVRMRECPMSSSMYAGMRKYGHFKSLGGYVVAPPSRTALAGGYTWCGGLSVSDVDLVEVDSMSTLAVSPASPAKIAYDRLFGRGVFVPQ